MEHLEHMDLASAAVEAKDLVERLNDLLKFLRAEGADVRVGEPLPPMATGNSFVHYGAPRVLSNPTELEITVSKHTVEEF